MDGVFTAIVTPFGKDGQIDRGAFFTLLDLQERGEIPGIVIGGTTGEGWALSDLEIEELYKMARERFSGKIILGTGAISTKETVRKTEVAKKLGADAALVVVPYYNLPSERGVINHYKKVAKVGIPIIVYHHPGRTGLLLSIECLEELAEIPGVVAIKETVPQKEYYLRLSKKVGVFCGSDNWMKEAKKFGACGVISVISNLYPGETKRFFASKEEDLSWILADLVREIFKEGNPSGIKSALKKKKYCEDFVREPLSTLSGKGIAAMEKIINTIDLKEFANK